MNNCFNFIGGQYDFWWWAFMTAGWFYATALSWKIDKLTTRVKKLEEKE